MNYNHLKNELKEFYWNNNNIDLSKNFAEEAEEILNRKISDDMSVTEQMLLQQEIITENFEPVIFKSVPFFFETGTLTSISDGGAFSKGADFIHAGGLIYKRNGHIFEEYRCIFSNFLICGHQ